MPRAPLAQGPRRAREREAREHAEGDARLRGQGTGGARQGDAESGPAARERAGARPHRHRARPGGEEAPAGPGHDEVADDEEDTHGRRGGDDDRAEGRVEGDVDPGEGNPRHGGGLSVEGDGDLGAPGRQQEQEGRHENRSARPHSGGRDVQESTEHEGFELSGHVADAQRDDDAEGEEGGEQDRGRRLTGARAPRRGRQGGRNEGRAHGTAGNDGTPPADGHAHDDAGEDAVHHGLGAELCSAQVDERRRRARREREQAQDDDRAQQVGGDHDRDAIASSALDP